MKTLSILASFFIFILPGNLLAQREFVTIWKTDNPGSSGPTGIYLPTTNCINFSIYWEQVGNEERNNGSQIGDGPTKITFPIAGIYRVKLSAGNGTFRHFAFQPNPVGTPSGDNNKLVGIEQWGDVEWYDQSPVFLDCINLVSLPEDIPDFSNVISTRFMFANCKNLTGNPAMNEWDMSNIRFANEMFLGCEKFTANLSDWDVSSVMSMSNIFSGCAVFNQPMGSWDVGNVTEMDGMFAGAWEFNQLIGSWNVGSVTTFRGMFSDASTFNQPLGGWDVGSGKDFTGMFQLASQFNQPIGGWEMESATSTAAMFYHATKFNQPIGSWNVSKVENMSTMFAGAVAFNRPLNNWNTSSLTSLWGTFIGASSFNQPLSNWNTSGVTDMRDIFSDASSFNQSLGAWDLSESPDMSGALRNIAMTCNNYDATLSGWAQNINTGNNISLDANGLTFDASQFDRQHLISSKGWTISGDLQGSCSALPVIFSYFYVSIFESQALVAWGTTTEINTREFIIQRSIDGKNWIDLGRHPNKGGNNSMERYAFTDVHPLSGSSYYRIKSVDHDNTYVYTHIGHVDFQPGKQAPILIYPNPATDKVTIELTIPGLVKIYDNRGIEFRTLTFTRGKNIIQIDKLPIGSYLIRTEDGLVKRFAKTN